MFKRKDGKKVKVDPFFRIIPLIMKERNDAQIFLSEEISLDSIDEYIKKKRAQGINLGCMHIIYSALVKTLKIRPKLNQFVINGRIYSRNDIVVSMAVKKDMSIEGEETTIKINFTGEETPEDIKNILKNQIESEKSGENDLNETDKFVKLLEKTPTWLLKFLIGFLMKLDKINLLPESIIKASPFHASAFVTNLGSIGLGAAYHHIYNFGTISLFLSIGKKNKRLSLKKGDIREEKTITLAIVADERISDGFYFASAFRQFFKYLSKPEQLENSEIGE